ncbi:MAG: PDZ domain-containing protein, partial [Erysipelotrichaceae bacterium]|nr:PDZ domain-containing protein [Erysipelotrichaceae bacterium]
MESERAERRMVRRHRFLIFLLAFFALLAGIVIGLLFSRSLVQKPVNQQNIYSEIDTLMKKRWLYSKEYEDLGKELEDKALHGMTGFEEDIFTSYMSKEEMDAFADSINRDYVGIGVEYSSKFTVPLVTKVFKDSPAEKAGILAGDFIISVDGESTENMSSEDLR